MEGERPDGGPAGAMPVAGGAFHRAGSAPAFTAADAAAETGTEERPLIAAPVRNFITQPFKE